jgi:hypothetical protein
LQKKKKKKNGERCLALKAFKLLRRTIRAAFLRNKTLQTAKPVSTDLGVLGQKLANVIVDGLARGQEKGLAMPQTQQVH